MHLETRFPFFSYPLGVPLSAASLVYLGPLTIYFIGSYDSLPILSWASYLTSLCFRFLICRMDFKRPSSCRHGFERESNYKYILQGMWRAGNVFVKWVNEWMKGVKSVNLIRQLISLVGLVSKRLRPSLHSGIYWFIQPLIPSFIHSLIQQILFEHHPWWITQGTHNSYSQM